MAVQNHSDRSADDIGDSSHAQYQALWGNGLLLNTKLHMYTTHTNMHTHKHAHTHTHTQKLKLFRTNMSVDKPTEKCNSHHHGFVQLTVIFCRYTCMMGKHRATLDSRPLTVLPLKLGSDIQGLLLCNKVHCQCHCHYFCSVTLIVCFCAIISAVCQNDIVLQTLLSLPFLKMFPESAQ